MTSTSNNFGNWEIDSEKITYFGPMLLFFRYNDFVSFPFAKNSPFLAPISNTLRKMMQSGALSRIWHKYAQEMTQIPCEDSKNTLGFKQLAFPIIIIVFGILSSCLLAIVEYGFCNNNGKWIDRKHWFYNHLHCYKILINLMVLSVLSHQKQILERH